MFSKSYNCFIAGLPDITMDDKKLALAVSEFRIQSLDYLSDSDRGLLDLFFLPNDNAQIIRLLRKEEADAKLQTVYPVKVLEEELVDPQQTVGYLRDFIRDYKEELLPPHRSLENELSERYYAYLMSSTNGFVRKYAVFVMNLRNLVTALNCRKHKLDIASSVIGDNEFSMALKSSNLKDFGLGMDYPYVERVLVLMEHSNLVERERGLDTLIWDFIDEQVVFEYFSIEKVMSYLLKLLIVERWSKMDSDTGRIVFMDMVEKFKKEFVFSGNE